MTRDEIKSLLIDHRCDHPSGELLDRLASAGASVVPKESTATDEVSVTQADRDAAAAYWRACGIGTDETRRHYAIGKGDDSNIVQAFARHRIASEQSRPTLSNKVVDTPLNKTFRAKSTSELKAKIYSAHGWKRKAGESMGERIAALYECSTDFERGDVVAKPRNPIATASEQPRTTQCSGDADRIVDCLCASLRGTDEAADQWTFAGMQDAFFRWPVVERELRRVLSALPRDKTVELLREARSALRKLAGNAGALGAFEDEIRAAAGNTNWQCLRDAITQADATLVKLDSHLGEMK